LAALRLAGAFLAALFFVAFLAGGTGTTFHGERSSLNQQGSSNFGCHSVRGGSEPHALRGQDPLTRFLKSEPTVNFTVFEAAI
jgi:hypothetical protein